MLSFFRRRRAGSGGAGDHEALLAALPVRNELVRESRRGSGLRLTAPIKAGALRKVFGGSRGMEAVEKTFELDELGAWVWGQCDGRRTVEGLIEAFAKNFRVNLREAEVSVLAFLKTLTQRNLVAHVAPKMPAKGRRRKARR